MKFLHIVPGYLPAKRYGGLTVAAHGLCKSLVQASHEVHVYTTSVDGPHDSMVPLEEPVNIDGVKVWYFRSKYLRRLYYAPTLKKALMQRISEFDILHLHSLYVWPTWIAARIAKQRGVPYIISPRGMLVKELIRRKNPLIKSAWLRFIDLRTFEDAAGIHMTSELEAREAEGFSIKHCKMFVIPNGLDVGNGEGNKITPLSAMPVVANNEAKQGNLLVYLGRINWKKGLDRLIPALRYLPGVHLEIAGNDEDDYQRVLVNLARKCGVLDQITFIGPVYGEEKKTLLKRATLFVLPSYSENFANSVLEAMAAGCPVVITPQVGLADVVQRSGAGIITEGIPKKLAENIRNILSKPDELWRMGERGQKTAKEHFRWDKIANEMESVYRQTCSSHSDK